MNTSTTDGRYYEGQRGVSTLPDRDNRSGRVEPELFYARGSTGSGGVTFTFPGVYKNPAGKKRPKRRQKETRSPRDTRRRQKR